LPLLLEYCVEIILITFGGGTNSEKLCYERKKLSPPLSG